MRIRRFAWVLVLVAEVAVGVTFIAWEIRDRETEWDELRREQGNLNNLQRAINGCASLETRKAEKCLDGLSRMLNAGHARDY